MIETYCITCSQTPERTRLAAEHFAERGIAVEFVHGIYGPAFFGRSQHLLPGYIGNILSHLMLWGELLRRRVPEALILEDDAWLEPNFGERFAQEYAQLDGADFAFIGWQPTPPDHRFTRGTHAYLVRASALPVLIRTNQRAIAPLDRQIAYLTLPFLRWRKLAVSLVGQRGWPSTCDGVE